VPLENPSLKSADPGEIVPPAGARKNSIFVWLDILGFSYENSDQSDEGEYSRKYRLLKSFQETFSFTEASDVNTHIIGDGILLEIEVLTTFGFKEILKKLQEKQRTWIQYNKQLLRGGIAVGQYIKDKTDPNSICATNGLSFAHKIETKDIHWPVIGTNQDHFEKIKTYFRESGTEEKFDLKHSLNATGADIYFLDFLDLNAEQTVKDKYQGFLVQNIKTHQSKESRGTLLKYMWLWRYFIQTFPDKKNAPLSGFEGSIL